MSWQKTLLNPCLRWIERSHMARAKDPDKLRRSLELKARMFFHGPRGMDTKWDNVGGVEALRVSGTWVENDNILLYFHGGGYVFGSPKIYDAMLGHLSKRVGAEAILPKYPLSPETKFPAALNTARAAYDGVRAQGYRPEQIIIGGDSAGGNLALALLAQLLRDGAATPAGAFAFSPVTDMTYSGASISVNASRDVILPAERVVEMAQMFLDGHDPLDPLVSPIHADFTGAPPAWITVGDTEILLDDTRRIVNVMQKQGVDAQMHIERDLPHVWPLFHNILPESRATLDKLADWISDRPGWSSGN
jgi:acetyl esterase/lipase